MFGLGSLFSFLAPVSAPVAETPLEALKKKPVQDRTQKENRLLLADYLENKVAGKQQFNMGCYDACMYGHARKSGLFGNSLPYVGDVGSSGVGDAADAVFGPGFGMLCSSGVYFPTKDFNAKVICSIDEVTALLRAA